MTSLLKTIKNLYLFWYYESYLQTDRWYKDYELKKIYGVCTLNIILTLVVGLPLILLILIILELPLSKYIVGGISLSQIVFTFYLIGKGDITDMLNEFYQNKIEIAIYRRKTLILFLVCLGFFILEIFYLYVNSVVN